MKDNVELIKRINEMRKEEQELQKDIKLMKLYKDRTDFSEDFQDEQRKELELMDFTIQRIQGELEQAQIENQELRMRRPPRNLAPIQSD